MSFFGALEDRDKEALLEILSHSSANVLENDISPLMYAAYHGLEEISKLLLKSGANLEFENSLGKSALHFAASGNQAKLVLTLCANGTSIVSLIFSCAL